MTESVLVGGSIVEVILNAKKGDENAYLYLINELKPYMISISKSYYIPKGEYEDLYQVCLIGLHRGVLSFEDKYSPKPILFLKMCIKREIYDLLRTVTRKKHLCFNESISIETKLKSEGNVEYVLNDTLIDDSNSLDDILLEKEFIKNLQNIMNKLSKSEKDIFSLYLEGFSQKEISFSLDIPVKKIDNALQRAKRKMRALILSA